MKGVFIMTYKAYKLLKKINKGIFLEKSVSPKEVYPLKELQENNFVKYDDNNDEIVVITIKGKSSKEEYAFERRKYFIELAIALFTLILTVVSIIK